MIFKKKRYIQSGSLSKLAWKKFLKNKTGIASLFVILIACLIALLGYLITPDHTPDANTQILEISRQKPGFKVDMLLIKKNERPQKTNYLKKMFFGENSSNYMVPITSYEFANDKIKVKIFDPDSVDIEQNFSIADVCFTINGKPVSKEGKIFFQSNVGGDEVRNIDDVQKLVEKKIVRKTYWLGTDQFGRDLLSRLIIGTRVSLSVGFISVAISLIIGILLGSVGGYFRGRTDDVIMWFINVVWSIPTLLLVIAITFALGRGFWQIFIAVGLTMWVEVARIVRGQIISIREKEFVEAGYALGFSNYRIISKHILPNVLSPVIVISAANFASAILIEAGLSFLGIGVQPPMPSWGSMIKENYSFIILDSAYLAIVPGIAIIIMVLAFLTLGNALRDALDVKTMA